MSDDEYARIARDLQAQPYRHGPLRTPPPWALLSESSKAYWLAQARAGERPQPAEEAQPDLAPTPLRHAR